MKSTLAVVALAICTPWLLQAQSTGGFSAPGQDREVRELRPGKPDDLKQIKPSGVIVMMSQHGLQVFNPLAPASLGTGKKNVTANIAQDGRIGDEAHDRKPFGGLILIGFDF